MNFVTNRIELLKFEESYSKLLVKVIQFAQIFRHSIKIGVKVEVRLGNNQGNYSYTGSP